MDLALYIWIAATNALFAFIASGVVGYLLYRYGKKQAETSYNTARCELRDYVKTDLMPDLQEGVQRTILAFLGSVGKQGSEEGRAAAAEYVQQNPNIASLLTTVAARGASRWLGKRLGVPKDVVDTLGGSAPFLPMQLGRRKGNPDLEPVVPPQI